MSGLSGSRGVVHGQAAVQDTLDGPAQPFLRIDHPSM